jgi:hypothetical protein
MRGRNSARPSPKTQLGQRAVEVRRDPSTFRDVGNRAEALINDQYSMSVTLPKLVDLFERATTLA